MTRASISISPPNFETLQREDTAIWKRHSKVTKALSAAAAEGNRSKGEYGITRLHWAAV